MTALSDVLGAARGRPAAELLDLGALELERELRGHPWIVASKGRVGFGAGDLLAYAPEAGRPIRLGWLAADPAIAERRSVDGLAHATAVREQVGDAAWELLRERAAAGGLDPDAATYLPVHPWQWEHRVLGLYAGALARGELVALGTLDDDYEPGQSLRTLAAAAHPRRRHLKLALSILNTSVYRGLPRARTLAAPALTQWLTGLCAADPFLRESGLVLLGEVASVSVAHSAFEAIADVPYQHTEMLGAIWREPAEAYLRERRARDHDGGAHPRRRRRRVVRRAADRAQRPRRRRLGAAAARGHAAAAAARPVPLRRDVLAARAELPRRAARRRPRAARRQGLRRRRDDQLRGAARARRHAGRRAPRARPRRRGDAARAVDPVRAARLRAPLPRRDPRRRGWATTSARSGAPPSRPSRPTRSASRTSSGCASRCSTSRRRRS